MCELIQHIVLEHIPRITGISSTWRLVAADVDILEVRTLLESSFHQVDTTRNDDRMQFAITFKSIEGDLVYLITKSIVRHPSGYLHDFLRLIGGTYGGLTTTPRLKDHIGVLEARHHLEMRARIDNAVPRPKASSEEHRCQTQPCHDLDEAGTTIQQIDDITDMTEPMINGLEHLVHDTFPLPSQPHLLQDDAKTVDIVALVRHRDFPLLGRDISPVA